MSCLWGLLLIQFSQFFNNILSIKCWQPKGSLECFWNCILVDEIQKSGNNRCGWKDRNSRDRQMWVQIRIQLLTTWPWESFLTLRVRFSYLWYKKSPEQWELPVEALINVPHLLDILCMFVRRTHVHLHCMKCCMGNRRLLIAFALEELKMLLIE